VRLDRVVRAKAQWLTAGWLHLDDLGAQLCEQKPAVRAEVDLAEFEDPNTVKRRLHDCSVLVVSGVDLAAVAAVDVVDRSGALGS
jgi:hypothetical protein